MNALCEREREAVGAEERACGMRRKRESREEMNGGKEERECERVEAKLVVTGANLLHGEYLMIEIALQLLVSKINTKLFKTVTLLVILKSKDIEYTQIELIGCCERL